jgi:aminopeptidase-like protein
MSTESNGDYITEGNSMYDLMTRLFPICRSITGHGVRETLSVLKETLPALTVHEVATGTKVFDWEIPKEWNVRDAYILDPEGRKIVDFRHNNLHLVGYSIPVDQEITLEELQQHVYSLEDQPDAIPYITSYYKERWGFCMSHNQRKTLKAGTYRVVIDSTLKDGHLTYGELILPGTTDQEIFLSTYVCHPSMANNELSGVVVTTALAEWIANAPRKYSYRIVFIPETIGSITYISRNLAAMQQNIVAGFNITCVGDDRVYSFLPSRYGDTLADKVAFNILSHKHPNFVKYSFLQRGSDERQYCSPGVDLPVVSIMRTKYGMYPEYHTSLDNLEMVSPEGLQGSFDTLKDCLELLENNRIYQINCLGEPQLGRRGLYPTLSTKETGAIVRDMMNFIAYADGTNDLIDISNITGTPVNKLYPIVDNLVKGGLLQECINRRESYVG